MAIRRVPAPFTLHATKVATGDGTFSPATGWSPAGDVEDARCTWEAHSETASNMVTRPAYQVCDVENNILATYVLGTDTQTGAGVKYPTAWAAIAANTAGRQLIRFGFYTKDPAGDSTLNAVRIGGVFEIKGCGG